MSERRVKTRALSRDGHRHENSGGTWSKTTRDQTARE